MLAEERVCLERHEQELAVRKACVMYLESVSADSEFQERTKSNWRVKLPSLPKWPSRRKSNKKRQRVADRAGPAPKRKCSTRSKVAGVFTSGATTALIKESFPNQEGIVISETAPIPEDLLDVSLEEVIFTAEWMPEVILPDNVAVINSSHDEIVEITPEVTEKELEPEKEKTASSSSRCLCSSAPGRTRKKKVTRKRRVRTQDIIEGGTYYSDESAPESVEDGCLHLGLSQDLIDLV